MFRFDLADRCYAVTGAEEGETQCVFIGEKLDREAITARMGSSVMEETFDPSSVKKQTARKSKTTLASLMRRP